MAEQEKQSVEEKQEKKALKEKEEKKSFEELFNKKERLKVIKQGILNHLSRVEESKRDTIADKLRDLPIDENPYEVYRGGKSRKVLANPTNEEINYCLIYLKGKDLITYDEKRKTWKLSTTIRKKKKGQTLDNFLNG